MLENEIVSCPVCDKELNVKVVRTGKNVTYVVDTECGNCKTSAGKIENMLNKSTKRGYVKTEKSYIKTDPRG